MNKFKRKGDNFERQLIHEAESMGLKGYRNRMSKAPGNEHWDICIEPGRRFEVKKRHDAFKKIREWMVGNEGVIIGCDYEEPLVVMRYADYLRMLV